VADEALAEAVAARFYAVNGRHEMTAEDDEYVSAWYVPLEKLAAADRADPDELRRLQLANRLPLPSYIRSDGVQMVARDLLALVHEAGGPERLREWFASRWESPEEAVVEWDDYLSGRYVCLRSVTPENMRRKNELIDGISRELTAPAPASGEWLDRLHRLVDELEELEPPFAPYDRLRFGGPVSRDRLIDDVRAQYPRLAVR
jgi:Family of unknown function (DUF6058)